MTDSAVEFLTRALSGHGINEKAVIESVGRWNSDEKKLFRQVSSHHFSEDERCFERWVEHSIRLLKHEFMRFKNAVVLWMTHPWERDARLIKEALGSKGYKDDHKISILIEISCTRSSDELLGARKAYHSLFYHSIEEDVASHVHSPIRKLLVALFSAYRYEGPKLKDESLAKSEGAKLARAINEAKATTNKQSPIEEEDIILTLSTRSKRHLHVIYEHYYKEIITGSNTDIQNEDLRRHLSWLQKTLLCLAAPVTYFTQLLDEALKVEKLEDKKLKKSLTRIIVTRADVDMKEIKAEYKKLYGCSLSEKIEDVCNGTYKDFLLTLLARSD